MVLADSDKTMTWLARFAKSDQAAALQLTNSVLEISYHDFMDGLTELILARSKDGEGPIALYAEREIKAWRGIPNRLFKESKSKPQRASGSTVQPVSPVRPYDPEVGSEGIIAQLITELCRANPKVFINHPGPDRIRKHRVRRFFLVTDLIGSGERASKYQRRVKKHPCRPGVYYLQSCPTIDGSFPKSIAQRLNNLCVKYDPIDRDPLESLGHRGSGALLVFAHSAPNNMPRMFHRRSNRWTPLFPSKVTASFRAKFAHDASSKILTAKLERIRQTRLSRSLYLVSAHPDARLLLLVLAALSRGPRFDEALSQKTRLTIPEIKALVGKAQSLAWINDKRRLTDEGHRQLEYARTWEPVQPTVVFATNEPYYPQQLRAPQPSS